MSIPSFPIEARAEVRSILGKASYGKLGLGLAGNENKPGRSVRFVGFLWQMQAGQ